MNYYQVLQIPFRADEAEIIKSFRELSKKYHPDVNPHAPVDFRLIIEAYKVLRSRISRRRYDEWLRKNEPDFCRESLRCTGAGTVLPPDRVEYSLSLSNIFRTGMKIDKRFHHSDYVENVGQDVILKVFPEEVGKGVAVVLNIPGKVVCPVCGGTGFDCYRCGGKRYVKVNQAVTFAVPINAQDGDLFDFDLSHLELKGIYLSEKTVRVKIVYIR